MKGTILLRCRMSAFGTKRTSQRCRSMSAFGGKADIKSYTLQCLLLTQSGLRMIGQITALGELQRLEICNSLRSPIHVLARSASAWLAATVLPRALYNSASPK